MAPLPGGHRNLRCWRLLGVRQLLGDKQADRDDEQEHEDLLHVMLLS